MASGPYSFIDIAVLEAVRGRFAAGEALFILTVDLETVLWANGAGAGLLGYPDIEAAMGAPAALGLAARRQMAATPGFPRAIGARPVAVRLAAGMSSRLATFSLDSLTLPDGEPAVLVAEAASNRASLGTADVAKRIIEGIGEAGYFAAIVDAEGKIAARSEGFDRLGIGTATLDGLVSEVAREEDRLVKKLIPCAGGLIPTGIARLTDEPALHLLIAVDETDEGELDVQQDEPRATAGAAGEADEPAETSPDTPPVAEQQPEPLSSYAENGRGDDHDELPLASDADLAERLDEDAPLAGSVHRQSDRPATDGAPSAVDPVNTGPGAIPPAEAHPTDEQAREKIEVPGMPVGQNGDADDWYFSRPPEARPAPASARTVERTAGPVRFVWRTDADGAFSMISPEFARSVGDKSADVVGRTFEEVAATFGLDPDGEIGRLLAQRDTWSGRTVLWPIEGTDLAVPVDLAALPTYGRDRRFEGFRGFGVARMSDAIVDPSGLGMRLDAPATRQPAEHEEDSPYPDPEPTTLGHGAERPDDVAQSAGAGDSHPDELATSTDGESAPDPFRGEVPVISIADRRERRASDKIIRLAEHRTPAAGSQLSAGERSAFEEIRERLRRDYEGAADSDPQSAPAPAEADTPEAAPSLTADNSASPTATGQSMPDADVAASDEAEPYEVGDDHHDLEDLAALDGIEEVSVAGAEDDALHVLGPGDSDPAMDPSFAAMEATEEAHHEFVDEGADSEVAAYREAAEAEAHQDHDRDAEILVEGTAEPRAEGDDAAVLADAETETSATGDAVAVASAGEDVADRLSDAEEDGIATSSAPIEQSLPASEAPQSDGRSAPPIETSGYAPSAFAEDVRRLGVDQDLIAGLPLPILIHAGDELYFANREFLSLTGYSSLDQIRREGGLGRLFSDGEPRMTAGSTDSKLRLRTLGGEEFPVDAHLQSVRWQDGTALLLSLRKVMTAPAAAPAPLAAQGAIGVEEMERRVAEMRTIVDTATDGVVLVARDGSIRSISRAAEALFGFDSSEVEGKPFHTLFAIESQRAARDYLNGLADNGVASVLNDGREVIGREAEGRFIPLFMTMGKLPMDSGFCAVVRDITQWKRAEEELTQARAQAERASTQKTEFLARVSHEIRTPLNAIIGFSELMIDEKFGPIHNDRYRDYLRDINRSGNHVLDLVNDLLDISKIEAGEQEMNYEAVSLNDTLAECVAMMQPQANRDRVIIRSSLASRLPEVVADLRSVRQIALNLLSNAIRYTQAGGQVIVSTSYEPSGDVVMRVRDTGIGMTLAEIDQALKPFKQINALKRGRHDGTGLGLPLTKAMVEANRARFVISSTPGEGTMVEVTFPSTRVLAD